MPIDPPRAAALSWPFQTAVISEVSRNLRKVASMPSSAGIPIAVVPLFAFRMVTAWLTVRKLKSCVCEIKLRNVASDM